MASDDLIRKYRSKIVELIFGNTDVGNLFTEFSFDIRNDHQNKMCIELINHGAQISSPKENFIVQACIIHKKLELLSALIQNGVVSPIGLSRAEIWSSFEESIQQLNSFEITGSRCSTVEQWY